MNFSFRKALDKFTEAPGFIYNSVRERILPTPGKRKREPEEPEEMQEKRPRKRGPAVEVKHHCTHGTKQAVLLHCLIFITVHSTALTGSHGQ